MKPSPRPVATCGVVVFAFLLAACADVPTRPGQLAAAGAASFSAAAGDEACTSSGAVVVTTETGLTAALAAAQSGDMVAISGTITLTAPGNGLNIPAGVTLTCAEPGAGVRTAYYRYSLFWVTNANVTISGLAFEGDDTEWPVVIQNGFPTTGVADVVFAGNSVTCGWSGCTFVVSAPRTIVSSNAFVARHETATGIHMQGSVTLRTSESRIENNTVTTLVPSGSPTFGAIRPRDGTDVVVRDNTVRGPWSNGISMAEILEGVFERNSIEGVTRSGFFFAGNALAPISVRASLFRANTVSSAMPALFVQRACANAFIANRLATPATVPNVVFTTNTGANVVLGQPVTVQDGGNYDCDGDGVNDPNSYKGSPHKGGYVGETMSEVMPNAGRIQMH